MKIIGISNTVISATGKPKVEPSSNRPDSSNCLALCEGGEELAIRLQVGGEPPRRKLIATQ
jgi:hypothetical protein